MGEDQRMRILSGDIAGVETALPPKIISVYLSSVGPDTIEERTALANDVYPYVREYCRNKHGLEFQMIDLKLGVSDDFYWDDHSLSEFCDHQLITCRSQPYSTPFFVTILSQRYGDVLAPCLIDENEYGQLLNALKRHPGRETRNWPLLEKCYTRDGNSVPVVYKLRHITQLQYSERDNWTSTSKEIARLLRKGSDYCFTDGVFSKSACTKYSSSEQRKEIKKAVELSKDFSSESFHVMRNIVDLKNYIHDDNTPTYIELSVNKAEEVEIDINENHLRDELKEFIETRVHRDMSILRFEILWRYDGVVNPKYHETYLNDFRTKFRDKIIVMINKRIAVLNSDLIKTEDSLLIEVRQHWTRCSQLSTKFFGREEELARLQAYMATNGCQPFIMHGEAGVGKTVILSRFALLPHTQTTRVYWTIVRYVGMTSTSSDLCQLLESLCLQIGALQGNSQLELSTNIDDLIRCFHSVLNNIPRVVTLVIILDGIDEMNDPCTNHNWIPMELPKNVKLVLSTESNRYDVLKKLKHHFLENCFLDIRTLDCARSEKLLFDLNNYESRRLTQGQLCQIRPILKECGNGLFLSLLSKLCTRLSSDTDCSQLQLPTTLNGMLQLFFDDQENQHGKILVSHSMAYMLASHVGLGDNEMQDILSLDDDALNEVLTNNQYKLRRLPVISWLGLKYSIRHLLFQYEVDDMTVCNFSNNSVVEYLNLRYMCCVEERKRTHALLADYFLGKWHVVKKYNVEGDTIAPDGKADLRLVASQPLSFTEQKITRFNKRKLSQLPRHLYLSENINELRKMVLFNYKWMYNKTCALSLISVIDDLQLYPCEEASLVEEVLRTCRPIIERDCDSMAMEITGRLLPHYPMHENIRNLINQCDRDGLSQNAVLPTFSFASVPGSTHTHTIKAENETVVNSFGFYETNRIMFMKNTENSSVYQCNLTTGKILNKILSSCGNLMITPDGMFMILVDHTTDKTIKIHITDSGKFVGQLIVMNYIKIVPKHKYRIGNVVISNDRLCGIVTAEMQSYLCIADIPTCRFLQIVQLYNRSDICMFSTDNRLVYCNAAHYLLTYNVYTLEHVASTSLSHRPRVAATSRDDTRIFIASDIENKISILHVYEGKTELTYKIVLSDILLNDSIVNMTMSNNDNMLLIRGRHNLILYSRLEQTVTHAFTRPSEVPTEFKLPRGHYTPLNFTQAEFSNDDKNVLGTIFRNVYIWDIDTGCIVSNIQTPVGIIDFLYVNKRSHQIVTHSEQTNEMHIWNIKKAVNKLNYPDSLTNSVSKIQILANKRYSFATCESSDEVVVIDMVSGGFSDLLTHGGKVTSFASSADARYVMVSLDTDRPNTTIRLWDLMSREVIQEFGNAPGVCLAFKQCTAFILISQINVEFNAPYYITQFRPSGDNFDKSTYMESVPYLLKSPFITDDDSYLVLLTADDYDRHTDIYCEPYIVLVDLQADGSKHILSSDTFAGVANVKTIIDVRCCRSDPLSVAVIYVIDNKDINNEIYNYGFLLMDIDERMVKILCEPFLRPEVSISDRLLFGDNFQLCIDEKSDMYTMNGGYVRRIEQHPGTNPQLLVLHDTALVYTQDSMFYVVRLLDDKIITRVDVHNPITAIALADDMRTIVIGCQNGSVSSYIIVDPDYDNVDNVIDKVGSRRLIARELGIQKYWDKINDVYKQYSRPASASAPPEDADPHLDEIKETSPLEKTPTKQLFRSTTCIVM